jgi:thioredoxin reductase (NADPH)
MAAGVYGASEGLTVLMVERCACGGQAGTSSRIENYLGFPEGISGGDLTGRGFKQATRFGAEVALTRSVEKLTPSSDGYLCELDGGQTVLARAVVLAIGVDWRRLQTKGEDRLLGRGIFYGVARQEATNVVGKKVFIVGGGNSAGQAAMFLSSYATEVKVLVRGEGLKLSMSQYLIGQIASKANIEVLPFTQVVSADGENHLERIKEVLHGGHPRTKLGTRMAATVTRAASHKSARVIFAVEVMHVFPIHSPCGRYANQNPVPNNSTEPTMK